MSQAPAPGENRDSLSRGDVSDIDSAWAEMSFVVGRSRRLSVLFPCSDSAQALKVLEHRMRAQAPSLVLLRPATPELEQSKQMLRQLQALPGQRTDPKTPVWIDLGPQDGTQEAAWDAVRDHVLSQLNMGRWWLENEFRAPIVIALPGAWRSQLSAVAPDLRSFASFSATVQGYDFLRSAPRSPQP